MLGCQKNVSAGCLGISFGSFCPQIGMNLGGFLSRPGFFLHSNSTKFDRDMIILMPNFGHFS